MEFLKGVRKRQEGTEQISPQTRIAARLAMKEYDRYGIDDIEDDPKRVELSKIIFKRHGLLDAQDKSTPGAEQAVHDEINRQIEACDREVERTRGELRKLRKQDPVIYYLARLIDLFGKRE